LGDRPARPGARRHHRRPRRGPRPPVHRASRVSEQQPSPRTGSCFAWLTRRSTNPFWIVDTSGRACLYLTSDGGAGFGSFPRNWHHRSVTATLAAVRKLLSAYPELAAVLAAAVIGLCVRSPLTWLAGHQGINVLLVILVAATAVTIDPRALRRLARAWPRILAAVLVGVTVLPALSWAVAHLVPAGPLRDGVLVTGLAPCEIASVATTALAGGEAAVA